MTPGTHGLSMQQGHRSYDKRMKEEFHIRNRTILRRPSSMNSEDDGGCPMHVPVSYNSERKYEPASPQTSYLLGHHHEKLMPLQERQACSEAEECKGSSHYKWSLTGWSSCLPKNLNADSTCGEGVRR